MKQNLLRLVLFPVILAVIPAQAATRSFTNPAGGNRFLAANWSPNGVLAGVDVASITNNGTYSVTILTGAVSVASVNLGGASGTQTLLIGTAGNLAITNAATLRKGTGSATTSFGGMNFVDPASSVIQSDPRIPQLPSPITNSAGMLRLNGGRIQSGGTDVVTGGMLEGSGSCGANAITGGIIGFTTGSVGGTFSFADANAFRYQYRFYRTRN
jgi:hypothetical protein